LKRKILHVASFCGNPGDAINHYGFYSLLDEVISENYEVTQLEIRKTYQNYDYDDAWDFDEDFAEYANKFDDVFVGGGANFELFINESPTGATISLTPKVLDKIKCNLNFYEQGFKIYKQTTEDLINRFGKFLKAASNKKNCTISVRNDGSLEQLSALYGNYIKRKIVKICDNAMFCPLPSNTLKWHKSLPFKKYIIFSLAEQLWIERFNGLKKDVLFVNVKNIIEKIMDDNIETGTILTPHIYSDFGIIYGLMKWLPERIKRSGRIVVSPYCPDSKSALNLLDIYSDSLLAITGRFHGAAASMSRLVPVAEFGGLPKVSFLIKEMLDGIDMYSLNINEADLAYESIKKLLSIKTDEWSDNLKTKINYEKEKALGYLKDIVA